MRRISIRMTILLIFVSISCSRIYDNVERFVDGEIVYIDKLDGIEQVQIGYERVEIDLMKAGRIPASQIRMAKAIKTVIECPDFTESGNRRVIDSICSWVNITGLTQLKYYEFAIYTEDEYGNRSLPLKTSARPYTVENLNALEITPPTVSASSSSAQIEWLDGISALSHQVLSYEWQYTDKDGQIKTGEDIGDKPVIFLENVATETDIPITLTCKIIPTISGANNTYSPIIDVVDLQKTLNFRLSSTAEDVIFLKTPIPGIDYELIGDIPTKFAWTKVNDINKYTLKFSLLPNFPEKTTFSLDTGDVNEYEMNNADMLNIADSLNATYLADIYWTVVPTVQNISVKTSYRLLKVWKAGKYYKYDKSDWKILEASSVLSNYLKDYVIDNNLSTFWHSAGTDLPHWLIIDMKTPKTIFKFDVYRSPTGYSDTKKVELYIGDSPGVYDAWTKIAEGGFSPTTTGSQEPFVEILTTNNVIEGRYLKLHLLDGRSGGNPYVNVVELDFYHQ